jgi:hypothetical protein
MGLHCIRTYALTEEEQCGDSRIALSILSKKQL